MLEFKPEMRHNGIHDTSRVPTNVGVAKEQNVRKTPQQETKRALEEILSSGDAVTAVKQVHAAASKDRRVVHALQTLGSVDLGNDEEGQLFVSMTLYRDDLVEKCRKKQMTVRYLTEKQDQDARDSFRTLYDYLTAGKEPNEQVEKQLRKFLRAMGWSR